jgi:hypothetical protein
MGDGLKGKNVEAKHDRDLLKVATKNLSRAELEKEKADYEEEISEECQDKTTKAFAIEIILKGLMTDEELLKIVSPEELKQVKREAVSEYLKQWK